MESQMKLMSKLFYTAALMLLASASHAATYTLTVEPNYPAQQAQEVYRPLIAYLSKSTGHTFVLNVAPNYRKHWQNMVGNTKVDFAFEEAHFTEYRISHQRMIPLVRVAEPAKFSLMVSDEITSSDVNTLLGRRITSMSSPSLGYLLLSEIYKNPIAQPEIKSFAASWKDGVEMIYSGESDAAIVPSYMAEQYSNLRTIYNTRELPGRALSASPAVPADVRTKVANAMLKLHLNNDLFSVINELGTSKFIPAVAATYTGNERLFNSVNGYVATRSTAVAAPPVSTTKPATATKK
jgi:ABC-type phosphate/phosphonate transport system substrate-binding protein